MGIEKTESTLIFLFEEMLALFRELIEVLKSERKWIVTADADQLWQMSDKKLKIISAISSLRERILDTLTSAGVDHLMTPEDFNMSKIISLFPVGNRKALIGLQSILNLKNEEIRQRSRENVSFVGDYLTMLDDLIYLFTRDDMDTSQYGRNRHIESNRNRPLMHREA